MIEDETLFCWLVKDHLEDKAKMKVDTVHLLQEARECLQKKSQYDLILLDVNLPDGLGFEFCKELQSNANTKNIPVLILSARADENDRILGLKLGAEDYISKPINLDELELRIIKRIRQARAEKDSTKKLKVGKLSLELERQQAFATSGRKTIALELSPTEFKILLHLSECVGKTVSRASLKDRVWHGKPIAERSIDAAISKLRLKIEEFVYIRSEYGGGYRLTLNPRVRLRHPTKLAS